MIRVKWLGGAALAAVIFFGFLVFLRGQNPALADYVIQKDVQYTKGDGEPQLLDLAVPKDGPGPYPLVVWIHGGGWRKGSKEHSSLFHVLAGKGFAMASINYRMTGVAFPGEIQDCKSAIRWLRAHAAENRIDPNRIGIWGGSAGGHLVALMGLTNGNKIFDAGENLDQSSDVQAVCDWYGPTDFISMSAVKPIMSSMLHGLLGPGDDAELEKKYSPITYVSASAPPFLIMHGTQDPTVPIAQSQELYDALKAKGTDVTYHPVEGAGHGGPQFGAPDSSALVLDFFTRTLKPNVAPAAATPAPAPVHP